MKNAQRYSSFILLFIVGALAVRCSRSPADKMERYREKQLVLGTFVGVDVCYPKGEEKAREDAYAQAWKVLWDLHERLSAHGKDGDVAKINRSHPEAAAVHPATFRLVKQSVAISEMTEGAFDITVKPLIDLWSQQLAEGRIPQSAAIESIRSVVGNSVLDLKEENKIRLSHPLARVDLGGIAKGYAVDVAAGVLRKNGFDNFMIDAGGDIYVSGKNCKGKAWRIGVRDPDRSEIMDVVFLKDADITTSGSYEQSFKLGGESWSHIMDPRTGYPLKASGNNRVASVSVIAPTAAEADALSTALSVLGDQQGLTLIDRLGEGYAALVVRYEGEGVPRREAASQRYGQFQALRGASR